MNMLCNRDRNPFLFANHKSILTRQIIHWIHLAHVVTIAELSYFSLVLITCAIIFALQYK